MSKHKGKNNHAAHAEEGEGNWLVSYADMMTLLVGFFVILLSFSKINEDEFEKVKEAAAKQFGGSYQVPYADLAARIRKELEKAGLGEKFIIKQNDKGVEISFVGAVFFDTGSAVIRPQGLELLDKFMPVVQADKEQFNVVIEGHTDDVPIRTKEFENNWELSSVRACKVLDRFEKAGFKKKRLTAVGYADSRPIVPNRDASGQPNIVNRSQNRRVVIRLLREIAPLIPSDRNI